MTEINAMATDRDVTISGSGSLKMRDIEPSSMVMLVEHYITREVGDEDLFFFKRTFISTNSLTGALETHPTKGLLYTSRADIKQRESLFGNNTMKQPSKSSFWELWLDAAKDKMMIILIVAAIVSLAVAIAFGQHPEVEWMEGFAILLSVFIVTTVTAGNDFAKEKQFRELQGSAIKKCTVVREGKNNRLDTCDLLVGDIILLEMGEEVPCDVVLTYSLGSEGIMIDESSMTGESDPSRKVTYEEAMQERDALGEVTSIQELPSCVIVGGTTIVEGSGYGMIVAVGALSQIGMNREKLAMDTEPTPLQNKLSALADQIGWGGGVAAIAIVLALTIQFWILWAMGDRTESAVYIFQQHLSFFTEAITIIVVAVPEGLPLAVTISLAYSVKKMLRDQNYVRKLAACEIMGGATDICSDKTGTLTKNRMTVVAFWNASNLEMEFKLPEEKDRIKVYQSPHKEALWQNIAINSTAALDYQDSGATVQVGNASECALLEFAYHLGSVRETVRDETLGSSLDAIVKQMPFTSMRKSMTTVIKSPVDPKMYRVLVKGASEVIMNQCTHRIDSKNCTLEFPEKQRERVKVTIIQLLATMALRTLCLGYYDFDPEEFPDWAAKDDRGVMNCEKHLICLGVFGIRDPVRDEVPGAVERMQKSGVTVRMVTGDNIDAAKSIAVHCNIYRPQNGGIAMLGPDFTALVGGIVCKWCRTAVCNCALNKDDINEDTGGDHSSDTKEGCFHRKGKETDTRVLDNQLSGSKRRVRVDVVANLDEMKKLENKLQVLARSQPQDKYTLVVGLRQLGRVVCVTGDGTNDAPALKRADVGMAMGLTGKDAAKEASDVVLLDDNFYGIVRACVWGRNIYENISRFLQFQLTVNVVAVSLSFITAFFVRSSALTTVQLLWLNMIMDTLAALALATDDPNDSLLDKPPVSREQGLVTKLMWRAIISNSVYQMIVACFIVFSGECWIPEESWLSTDDVAYIHNGGMQGECEPGTVSSGVDKCLEKYPAYPNFAQYHVGEHGFCNWIGNKPTVTVGRAFRFFSETSDYPEEWLFDPRIGASRHYTVVFNTFVFMQVFNLLLSRKLGNDLDVFSGMWTNKIWVAVFLGATILQVIFCEYGGVPLSVHPAGLTWQQWLISIALGFGMLPWGLMIKLIPQSTTDALMPREMGSKEVDPLSNERVNSIFRMSSNRLSSRMLIYNGNKSSTLKRNISAPLRDHSS
eukprot:GHVH01004899.1.p1 GENE.GHVH01004899.1~~GHVH01004899.1.p1  ORF type:complete len:1214 (+),score=176.14 GHVH01004899.1:420-4061(+)